MNKNIVWFDDDMAVIWLLKEGFEEAGYHVDQFESIVELLAPKNLEKLKKADILILDLLFNVEGVKSLKGGSDKYAGVGLIKYIRNTLKVKVPILIYTAVNNPAIEDDIGISFKDLEKFFNVVTISKPSDETAFLEVFKSFDKE